jgi:hypothetical protein
MDILPGNKVHFFSNLLLSVIPGRIYSFLTLYKRRNFPAACRNFNIFSKLYIHAESFGLRLQPVNYFVQVGVFLRKADTN